MHDILSCTSKPILHETLLAAVDELIDEGYITTFCSDSIIRRLCSLISTNKCYHCIQQGNRSVYFYMKLLDKNVFGTDIATSKLWLSTFLLQQGDYCNSLRIINYVMSSIPPYVQYHSVVTNSSNCLSKQLYVDTYCKRNSSIIRRAKEAWLKDMFFISEEYPFLPRAIQIELCYCSKKSGVLISPFTYAYYLMFLCYHGLGQYDNRDRALRQLVDTVNDRERCCVLRYHSYNVAGHCMLIAGYMEEARRMFLLSAEETHKKRSPAFDKYNSSYKYLSLMWPNMWFVKNGIGCDNFHW